MHTTLNTLILALTTCAAHSPPVACGSHGDSWIAQGRASVEVRSDVGWIGPGQTFNIIVAISPEPDWHVYWKNPGASGAPTEFEISAPAGFKVGEPTYPRPSIIQTSDGPTYGYNELAAMFIPVTAPQTFDDETATFEILTMWLACKKICVLGEHETKLTLSTNPKTEGPHHKDMRLLRWQKRLPKPLKDLKEGSCHIEGTELVISGISGDQPISFIGLEHMGIRFNRHKSSEAGGGKFTITVPLTLDFTAAETDTIVVEGLLLIGRNPHDPSYVVRVSAKAPN